MQFKLLQTYRVLSNFSISLIMEFIPFIIFGFALPEFGFAKALSMMFAYWVIQCLLSYVFNTLLKKWFFSKPQIFLLLRVIPIIACEICIVFLSTNSWIAIILAAIFSALEMSFNTVPIEVIYNYVSVGQDEKVLGVTRFLDQMGWFIAGIVGGFCLDNIAQWIIITFSLTLFVIGAIPLFVFYFKFRKDPTFNKDYVSYAVASEDQSEKVKKLKKSFIFKHFITSFLTGPAVSGFYYMVSALLYFQTGSFFITGLITSTYDGLYGLGCLVTGKLLTKFDGKNLTTIAGVYLTVSMLTIYFVPILPVRIVAFLLGSFIQPALDLHLYQTYLDKARILGCGNAILVDQCRANSLSYATIYAFGIFGWLPIIIASTAMAFTGAFVARKTEESTTVDLVDYLNNNE